MSSTKLMMEQYQTTFETYMDEMVYDYMFEQMMPGVMAMVLCARDLKAKN